MNTIRTDANTIIRESIAAVLPDEAVFRALKSHKFDTDNLYLVSIGKAAYQMAKAACQMTRSVRGESDTSIPDFADGIVITKYGHVGEPLPGITCFEAGHPVPDENSYSSTEAVIKMVEPLTENSTVLFLVSGGGSALFEKPLISGEEMANITKQLLACGADITEINTLRKRLSAVKGGKFARLCAPAKVYSIVLSDIVGDPLDMIASGPAVIDTATSDDAMRIVDKYKLTLSDEAMKCLLTETPKELHNVETEITGSVRELCRAASKACESLGYEPHILTDKLTCEASEAGYALANLALEAISPSLTHNTQKINTEPGIPNPLELAKPVELAKPLALIAGGETVVHLKGDGLGGRNQELVLAAAVRLLQHKETALTDKVKISIFSVGSDGTDGPTDAAGGYIDTDLLFKVQSQGIDLKSYLDRNDAYHALEQIDGLVMTGPTGTNVNDVSVLLLQPVDCI